MSGVEREPITVEILSYDPRNKTTLVEVVCTLEGETVSLKGKQNIIDFLVNEGVSDFSEVVASGKERRQLFPSDGLDFLQQLSQNFKHPSLFAGLPT